MVYIPFSPDTPDIADTGAKVIDDSRQNLMALRDGIVAGVLVGWNMAATGGTPDEPTQIMYSKGTERLRLTIVWGTTGGEDGSPKTVTYVYSPDAIDFTTFPIGTWTGTYDANGSLTAETWS